MKNSWYGGCRVVAKQASLALSLCICIVSSTCKDGFIVVLINKIKNTLIHSLIIPTCLFFLVIYKKQHLWTWKDRVWEESREKVAAAQGIKRYPSWPCWHGDSKASRCSSTAGLLATALGSHHRGSAVKTHRAASELESGFIGWSYIPFIFYIMQVHNTKRQWHLNWNFLNLM